MQPSSFNSTGRCGPSHALRHVKMVPAWCSVGFRELYQSVGDLCMQVATQMLVPPLMQDATVSL